MDDLERDYHDYLDAFDLRTQLERELNLEDEYSNVVARILGDAGLRDLTARYSHPMSFSGGSDAPAVVFAAITDGFFVSPAEKFGMPVRPYFCGLVPSGRLSALTKLTSSGGLTFFDMGLWFYIRFACQQVALELFRLTGQEKWGTEGDRAGSIASLVDGLTRYASGVDTLRTNTHVFVINGRREAFRRALTLTCIAWVMAHEYAHMGIAAQPDLYPGGHQEQWSEQTEMSKFRLELEADQRASRLVAAALPEMPDGALLVELAGILVLFLQALVQHTEVIAGVDAPTWTHPAPELRAEGCAEGRGLDPDPERDAVARTFLNELEVDFHLQDLMRADLESSGWIDS
jgi:hypothetical protein